MEESNKVSFLSSITTKVTIVLMVSFAAVMAIVFYVVSNEGYEKMKAETTKVAIEAGKLTVSYISSDLNSIESNTDQIRDNGEMLPLQIKLLKKSLLSVLSQNSPNIIEAGIIPTPESQKYFPPLHQSLTSSGIAATHHLNNQSTKQSKEIETSLLNLMPYSQPQNCFWGHSTANTKVSSSSNSNPNTQNQQSLISCAMPIFRNSKLWGMATVKTDNRLINETLNQLNDELAESYAVIFDNNNRIIASSDNAKLPIINQSTGKSTTLTDFVQQNTAWQPLIDRMNENRKQAITTTKPQIFASVLTELEMLDIASNAEQGSMLLNYSANQKVSNSDLFDNSYIDNVSLTDDSYFRSDSLAYLFVIPKTSWHLVIVQSAEQVNGVASDLSKNIIKYVMFALLAMLALVFFMIDFLALRPMEQTAQKILKADELINNNLYNQLSSIKFPKIQRNELGVVNGSLKKMLNRIEDNEGKLANINQELETKVEERTSELKNAMSELKSSQVQLIRSEKMATLGQMVAGVAHEVNTPLTYVQNNVEIIGQLTEQYEELIEMVTQLRISMVNEDTPEDDIEELMGEIIELGQELEEDDISVELKELIKDSLFGVEQITEMVLNLRNFARLDESKIKPTDLRECVDTSLKIARNTIKNIQVNTNLFDIPMINCSPSQINQVIINLLNNASQAIDGNKNGQIDIRTVATNSHIYIDIKDNGSGMSEEVVAKIFEPFFTTKAAGDGTGLGMAISHQIMEQHNGEIQVKSKEGVGTLFRLALPIDNTISNQ